jgi:hypothetical protein
VDVLEIPGCPDGSLRAIAYLRNREPDDIEIRTPDGQCAAVLKIVLPLLGYIVVDAYAQGSTHVIRIRRAGRGAEGAP